MLSEKGKKEIKKMMDKAGGVLSSKEKELNELRIEGEDKISVFMNAGELPSTFNDPGLNARDNLLFNCRQELDKIHSTHTVLVGQIDDLNEEKYMKEMKEKLNDLEGRIAEI